jgi:N-acetylmuramic acid 6-phosphate (MurNAc-6-P) etherase
VIVTASGTTPLVIAEMIFCRSGATGVIVKSIVLPLVFS